MAFNPLTSTQSCSRSPDEVNAERNAARLIQQQEEDSQKLRDRVSVLAHAKETDGRRFKQIAVERQREREDLTREVDRLKVCFCPLSALCRLSADFLVVKCLVPCLTQKRPMLSTHTVNGIPDTVGILLPASSPYTLIHHSLPVLDLCQLWHKTTATVCDRAGITVAYSAAI